MSFLLLEPRHHPGSDRKRLPWMVSDEGLCDGNSMRALCIMGGLSPQEGRCARESKGSGPRPGKCPRGRAHSSSDHTHQLKPFPHLHQHRCTPILQCLSVPPFNRCSGSNQLFQHLPSSWSRYSKPPHSVQINVVRATDLPRVTPRPCYRCFQPTAGSLALSPCITSRTKQGPTR